MADFLENFANWGGMPVILDYIIIHTEGYVMRGPPPPKLSFEKVRIFGVDPKLPEAPLPLNNVHLSSQEFTEQSADFYRIQNWARASNGRSQCEAPGRNINENIQWSGLAPPSKSNKADLKLCITEINAYIDGGQSWLGRLVRVNQLAISPDLCKPSKTPLHYADSHLVMMVNWLMGPVPSTRSLLEDFEWPTKAFEASAQKELIVVSL